MGIGVESEESGPIGNWEGNRAGPSSLNEDGPAVVRSCRAVGVERVCSGKVEANRLDDLQGESRPILFLPKTERGIKTNKGEPVRSLRCHVVATCLLLSIFIEDNAVRSRMVRPYS